MPEPMYATMTMLVLGLQLTLYHPNGVAKLELPLFHPNPYAYQHKSHLPCSQRWPLTSNSSSLTPSKTAQLELR